MEAKWFIDNEGEFGLFVNGEYHVFHKWADSVVCQYTDKDVTFLADGNAQSLCGVNSAKLLVIISKKTNNFT